MSLDVNELYDYFRDIIFGRPSCGDKFLVDVVEEDTKAMLTVTSLLYDSKLAPRKKKIDYTGMTEEERIEDGLARYYRANSPY